MLAVSQTARHDASAATPDFSSRSSRPSHPDCRCTEEAPWAEGIPCRCPPAEQWAPFVRVCVPKVSGPSHETGRVRLLMQRTALTTARADAAHRWFSFLSSRRPAWPSAICHFTDAPLCPGMSLRGHITVTFDVQAARRSKDKGLRPAVWQGWSPVRRCARLA